MIDIVPTTLGAAVARKSHRTGRRLFRRRPERFRPFPVLRSMSPHMHLHVPVINITLLTSDDQNPPNKQTNKQTDLHVVITIEGFTADSAGELRWSDEDLRRGRNPELRRLVLVVMCNSYRRRDDLT